MYARVDDVGGKGSKVSYVRTVCIEIVVLRLNSSEVECRRVLFNGQLTRREFVGKVCVCVCV